MITYLTHLLTKILLFLNNNLGMINQMKIFFWTVISSEPVILMADPKIFLLTSKTFLEFSTMMKMSQQLLLKHTKVTKLQTQNLN